MTQFKLIERYNGCSFIQTVDLDFGSETSTGFFVGNSFNGTYNGNGHKISNLMLANANNESVALFYSIGKKATVENLTLNNIYVTTVELGAVLAIDNYGKVKDVTIDTCYVSGSATASGALVVHNQKEAAISSCHVVNSSVSASKNEGDTWIGGILCDNMGLLSDSDIKESSVNSKLNIESYIYSHAHCAGLVSHNTGNMINCRADNIDLQTLGRYDSSAGISSLNEGTINRCSFTGTVSHGGNTGVCVQNGTFIN